MKLIEKLAEDWWLEQRKLNETGDGVFEASPASFEAGFRKAREMAANMAMVEPLMPAQVTVLAERLKNLGESEAKE